MAEAELIITPEVARAELNRAVDQMNKAMEKAAKEAGDDLEREIARGIRQGGRAGVDGMGAAGGRGRLGMSANVIDGLKKAGGILGGAAVVALGVGVNEIMSRVEIGMALIDEKMSESQAPETIAAAQDLGLSGAEYQAIRAEFRKVGVREDKDITETLREITVMTEEAERGGDPLLSEFAGKRGITLYREVFESLANVEDPAKRMAILARLNEEQTNALSKIVQGGRAAITERVIQPADRAVLDKDMAFKTGMIERVTARIAELEKAGGESELVAGLRGELAQLKKDRGALEIQIAGGTERTTTNEFFAVTEASKKAADTFKMEAEKVEAFRTAQVAHDQKEDAAFWNDFDVTDMNAYFDRQTAEEAQRLKVMNDLAQNVSAANVLDEKMAGIMDRLSTSTASLVGVLTSLEGMIDKLATIGGQREEETFAGFLARANAQNGTFLK